MSFINNLSRIFTERSGFKKAIYHILAPYMSEKCFLIGMYEAKTGEKLDLAHPVNFNQKLQWIKIYDHNPMYTRMVDKLGAKEYVNSIIPGITIPTLGVWDKPDDILFEQLPNQFVLKVTHDSGGLIICKDKTKLDIQSAKLKLKKALKTDYYVGSKEWPYKDVSRRIIAEKYMVDESGYELKDYKFFCFDGVVKCYKIDFDRATNHRANYFDRNSKLLPFGECVCPPDYNRHLDIPSNIDEMIEVAENLSKGHPFLRVDLYNINGKIYFGELTFFPASGFGAFTDESWNIKLGKWIKLPTNERYENNLSC